MSHVRIYHQPSASFVKVPNEFARSTVKAATKAVVLHLASHAATHVVHLTVLAKELGMDRGTVRAALRDAGESIPPLVIAIPTGAGKDQHNNPEYVYHVSLTGFTAEERETVIRGGEISTTPPGGISTTKKTTLLEDHSEPPFGLIGDEGHSDINVGLTLTHEGARSLNDTAATGYPHSCVRLDDGTYEYDGEELDAWLDAKLGLDTLDYNIVFSMSERGAHPRAIYNTVQDRQLNGYHGSGRR